MSFADLEARLDGVVVDRLANASVSINGGPSVRGIFDTVVIDALGVVTANEPSVQLRTDDAEGVERDAEVLINGSKLYRVIGIIPEGGLVTLRLAA